MDAVQLELWANQGAANRAFFWVMTDLSERVNFLTDLSAVNVVGLVIVMWWVGRQKWPRK